MRPSHGLVVHCASVGFTSSKRFKTTKISLTAVCNPDKLLSLYVLLMLLLDIVNILLGDYSSLPIMNEPASHTVRHTHSLSQPPEAGPSNGSGTLAPADADGQ